MDLMEGQMARTLDLRTVSTKLHQTAELGKPVGARRSNAAQRNHVPEEPDAGIPHVRICGGPGRVTARAYPTPMWRPCVGGTYIDIYQTVVWE